MIEDAFKEIFGVFPAQTAYAPGRVNLLGEHIDYNGGSVLPMALKVGLTVAISPREDDIVRIASTRFDDVVERDLHSTKHGDWADYAVGAVQYAERVGFISTGVDLFIESTIPDGAGLSSSAALIVAILKAARDLANASAANDEIAVLAKQVENDYIGMPCGIMDQMAVAIADAGQAIALNTHDLSYERIQLPKDYHFAVIHSGQHRKLADGRYAARKAECDKAKSMIGVQDLCLLSKNDLEKLSTLPTALARRTRHCMTEHQRVLDAVDAIKSNDMHAFGNLMIESHASMREDFEISTPEIDALVEDALRLGAVGARLTGGGFGGCVVACIPTNSLDDWVARLLTAHPNARFIC